MARPDALQPLGQDLHEPFAMKAAVLDEDGRRVAAGEHPAAKQDVRHVSRASTHRSSPRLLGQIETPHATKQRVVRVIAGQQEHPIGRQRLALAAMLDNHRIARDFDDVRLETRRNRALGKSGFDVSALPGPDRSR